MADSRTADDQPTSEEAWVYRTIQHDRRQMEAARTEWNRHIRAYKSEFYSDDDPYDDPHAHEGSDDESMGVEANLLFAYVEALAAVICPPKPRCDITAAREDLKNASRIRQKLVHRVFQHQKMANKLQKLAKRGTVFPRAFLKEVWDETKKKVRIRVLRPHHVFHDTESEEWEDVRYVCEVTVLTQGQFMRRVHKKGKKRKTGQMYDLSEDDLKKVAFTAYPGWLRGEDGELGEGDSEGEGTASMGNYRWVVVYEFYDLVSETFYHFVEGREKPVYAGPLPYLLHKNPFFLCTFNDNLMDNTGLSDAKLIYPLLEQINEMSSLRLWHSRTTIPVPVVHEGLMDDADEFSDQYENIEGPGDVLRLAAKPQARIEDVLGQTPTTQLPSSFDATIMQLRELIEYILALPATVRGQTGNTDIATESVLADDGYRMRNRPRQGVIYDAVAWAARGIINLYAEFLGNDEELFLRLQDDKDDDAVKADRKVLALPPITEKGGLEAEDEWMWDYEALPYSGDDGNRVVRLKKLVELMPSLIGHPDIDQRKLMAVLTELADIDDILKSKEQAAADQQVMQQQQMQMAAAEQGTDPAAGGMGATPAAPDPMMGNGMDPAVAGNFAGGQVGVGGGEMAAAGPMGGV